MSSDQVPQETPLEEKAEKIEETELFLDEEKIRGFVVEDGVILVGTTDDYIYSIDQKEFRRLFPTLAYGSGLWFIVSQSGRLKVPINPDDKKTLDAFGINVELFQRQRESAEASPYTELIKEQGLDKEYCICWGGRILAHAPTREELDRETKDWIGLNFTIYDPHFLQRSEDGKKEKENKKEKK
jgi:hypothetical protein